MTASHIIEPVADRGVGPRGQSGASPAVYPRLLYWVARLPFRPTDRRGTRLHKLAVRGWYQFLSFMDRRASMVFMNYGYASLETSPPAIELRDEDAKDRYCIQLYHRVASAVDLRGKDVLEVGCGRGGGASFVARYLGPRTMTGVDFARNAVAFCRRLHGGDGVSFARGDAEHLPFAAGSFDVVLNVESSHCYPDVPRFLGEAARVLRPGGHLLFADMRPRSGIEVLREQFRQAGLVTVEEEEITPNVVRALELDNDRKLGLIQVECPTVFRPLFRCFAGIEGTSSNRAFRDGEWVYWRFALEKRADPEPGAGRDC